MNHGWEIKKMMKLFMAPNSPFTRKCRVLAMEAGLRDQIELWNCTPSPFHPDRNILSYNPMAQVPTLVLEDGTALFDSSVICEYMNERAGTDLLRRNDSRYEALKDQACGDTVMDAALTALREGNRPKELFWQEWQEAMFNRIERILLYFEKRVENYDNTVDIGKIGCACALSYLDHRHPTYQWRQNFVRLAEWYGAFSQRESMQLTPLGIVPEEARSFSEAAS